ncbi:PREDICTED: diphthamide biosynthesis protein 2-like [Camelina sativa]|uniref:Diphthamide biosynthesis protein 2-like n=1 Tax=Camelina sativa TaxID=90675 RepID=A0ABM0WCZ4_CAMSA|nr:PREDICTED: diphthamide biosynthesis protein 2-like [Camelina sativa]
MDTKKLDTAFEDAISCLPHEVLSDILSRVPTKLAASTSLLSKKWRNVFATVRAGNDHILQTISNFVNSYNLYFIISVDLYFLSSLRVMFSRYYLVEKAKDANIVGILVGTLGVAGYLHMIHHMQALISAAGKKSYILAMGRPNSAKLANFPECDVFIYISCAQTALLDSKKFMSPVITPFEANIAFSRGSEWTGAYLMQFQDVINSVKLESEAHSESEEPRFSFFQGGYVEDHKTNDQAKNGEEDTGETMALVHIAEKALQLKDNDHNLLTKQTTAKSGPEYFLSRAYRGLEINSDNTSSETYIVGRSGKASGYKHE